MKNPFALITSEDCAKYSGKTIAVDMATGKIVESGDSVHDLKSKMKNLQKYARITLP